MRRTAVALAFTTALTAFSSISAAEITSAQWGAVVNLAGRQRMLSQKMTKEALLVASSVSPARNRELLGITMDLFESTLVALRDGDTTLNLPACENPKTVRQLDQVASLYARMKPILAKVTAGQNLRRDDIIKLAQYNVPVLENMNKAVGMFEADAAVALTKDPSLAVIINVAGRQRMLSQKLSKEALLMYLKIDEKDNARELLQTATLFSRSLVGLKDGDRAMRLPATTAAAIRAQLDKIEGIWRPFVPTVNRMADPNTMYITMKETGNVMTVGETLLKETNRAVDMYEDLAK